jgi:hypothetical protein
MHLHSAYTLFVSSTLVGLALASTHCGGSVVVDGGAGGSTPTSSASNGPSGPGVTTGSGGPTTTSSGVVTSGGGPCNGPGGSLPNVPCTPTVAACKANASVCLALVDNSGASPFGLRMSDLSITAPPSLTKGLIKGVIENGVTLNDAQCNLNGGGTLSWLLQLDTVAGTLRTGGAHPQSNPDDGYAFDDEVFPQGQGVAFHVQPVTLSGALDAACATTTSAADLNLPVFFDLPGSAELLLPLRQTSFTIAKLSSDHNCIGEFNAAALDPASGCVPDSLHPGFLHAGQVSAYLSLEEADTVVIAPIGQTLCVVLSGDAAAFGDGAQPTTRCKRDGGGHIVFNGDWCAAEGQPATPECHDALRFEGSFAASAVRIK